MLRRFEWRIAALLNGFQDAAAYRGEYFLELLGSAFVPAAMQLFVWYSIFKVGGASQIAGQTHGDLIAYTLTSVLFTQVRGGDHDFALAEMIRTGQLSQSLLRPASVVEFVYLQGLAPRLIAAGLCLGIGILISPWTPVSVGNVLIGMVLAIIGNIIHFQIGAVLATLAFAWEEAYVFLMVKNMVVSLLSGEMIPLTLVPEKWAWVWKSLPFHLYVFGPTEIALGKWSGVQILEAFTMAGAWFLICALLVRFSWRYGIRRYSSIGG